MHIDSNSDRRLQVRGMIKFVGLEAYSRDRLHSLERQKRDVS